MHSPGYHYPVQRRVQLRHHHLPWQCTHDGSGQAIMVEHWIKVAKVSLQEAQLTCSPEPRELLCP